MNAKVTPSEFTEGAFWVWAEWTPPVEGKKLSKSEKPGLWVLVSSWDSRESADAAAEWFRRHSNGRYIRSMAGYDAQRHSTCHCM